MSRARKTMQGGPVGRAVVLVVGWLLANAVFSLGIVFIGFVMFANGSAEGFFAEMANLSRHFELASPERRDGFLVVVRVFFAVVFLVVCALRARGMIASVEASCRGKRGGVVLREASNGC